MTLSPRKPNFLYSSSHTGHDAEHLGPDDKEQEHSARSIVASKTSHCVVRTGHDAKHLGPHENTARGAAGPRKPAMYVPVPLRRHDKQHNRGIDHLKRTATVDTQWSAEESGP